MWITLQDKTVYNDSSCKGLKVYFDKLMPNQTKQDFVSFIRWLRRYYWFPIRLNLHIIYQKKFKSIDDGHLYYGIFYSEPAGRRKCPCICIASKTESQSALVEDFVSIAHEITHYYQWYFYEDEKKSNLSLEREANKLAKQIVYYYITKTDTAIESSKHL